MQSVIVSLVLNPTTSIFVDGDVSIFTAKVGAAYDVYAAQLAVPSAEQMVDLHAANARTIKKNPALMVTLGVLLTYLETHAPKEGRGLVRLPVFSSNSVINPTIQEWLTEQCLDLPDAFLTRQDAYKSYKQHAGPRALSRNALFEALRNRGCAEAKRKAGVRGFVGLTLKHG